MTLDRHGHLYADELDDVADRLDAAAAEVQRGVIGARPRSSSLTDASSRHSQTNWHRSAVPRYCRGTFAPLEPLARLAVAVTRSEAKYFDFTAWRLIPMTLPMSSRRAPFPRTR